MPSKNAHEAMADRCQATIDFLLSDRDQHSEWIAVVSFYRALHLVEMLFAALGVTHSRNHESRESVLKTNRKYENIWKHYRVLWSVSTNARYLSTRESFSDYMSPEKVENEIVKHRLRQVENSVRKLMPTAT